MHHKEFYQDALANLAFIEGHFDQSKQIYLRLSQKYPHNLSYKQVYIESLIALKEYQLAESTLKPLLKDKHISPNIHLYLTNMYAQVLFEQGHYTEAQKIYEKLLKNPRMQTKETYENYIYLLENAQQWSKALEIYTQYVPIASPQDQKRILWIMRNIKQKALGTSATSITYISQPESITRKLYKQETSTWIKPQVRLSVITKKEQHHQKGSDNTRPFEESIVNHTIKLQSMRDRVYQWSASIGSALYPQKTHIPLSLSFHKTLPKKTIHIKGEWQQPVSSTLSAFELEATTNKLHVSQIKTLTEKLSWSSMIENESYHVRSGGNIVNGDKDLGYKWIIDNSLRYLFSNKPILEGRIAYRHSHWHESFGEADTVIDFTENERLYRAGLYFEHNITENILLSMDIERDYERKKDNYSTYLM